MTPSLCRFSFILAGFTIGLAGCEPTSQTTPANSSTCRLQRFTAESTSPSQTVTEQRIFTYNDQQNLSRVDYSYTARPKIGTNGMNVTSVTDHTYDSDGFLLASNARITEQRTDLNGQSVTENWSANTTYAYVNGRISSFTTVNTIQAAQRTTTTGTYAYDGADRFTLTETTGDFERVYTYSNGVLTDYVERNGSTVTRPWEIKDGMITRMAIPGGWVGTYQYDGNFRRTRMDEAVNGKQNRYTTTIYAQAKSADEARPAWKGHPVVRQPSGKPGVLTGENAYVLNEVSGQFQFFSEMQASVQTNQSGFVTSRTSTTRNPTVPGASTSTSTETYTYTNCP